MTDSAKIAAPASAASPHRGARVTSLDALRGLVMFTMIFVNDIAGVSEKIVPAWMRHYHGKSGMTFVDLVFPAFLFIVGTAIPFALGSRLASGEPLWKTFLHVITRTLSLLIIGVLMVNEVPSSKAMGWSGTLWSVLMFLAAMLAFCSIGPSRKAESSDKPKRLCKIISIVVRVIGFAALAWLAFAFRGENGRRIITLSPFSIHTSWYGILGLIGLAYLVGSIVFLFFRTNRVALLGCIVLLTCLYAADRKGLFDGFWLARYVGIGGTLGSQAAITVAGILLASILVTPETASIFSRARFVLLFVVGFAAAALLLNGLYGINKNNATPSWCLWSCAITAALWFVLYCIGDLSGVGFLTKPLAVAGQNVLLAYLISEMLPSLLDLLHLGDWYGGLAESGLATAVTRSAGCAIVILSATAGLNRIGFRLKL